MAIYRGPGGTGDSTANASGDAAIASTAAANAAASATAAANSAASAGVDAGTAQNAANNAANSQTAAATSAGNAATSASNASSSASAASSSQTAAALSESNTATLYDNFDDRYLGVKTTSPAVDNDGNTLQEGALYFNSTTKGMYVWNSTLWVPLANEISATNAATSAAAALASQNAASTSASNAATSATNSSNSATTASTQATNASNSASAASTSASNASTSATASAASASTATTQASNASTSATNAASSASAASTSASNASTSASNASTSASNAATSATNAAASYDAFDDRYLGAKASAPTVDNDGNALLTGAIYWSTAVNSLYVWDGSSWLPAAFSSAGNVTSFNTRTGAITLTSGDVTGALTYTPVTNARTLTINGTAYDLTADRTWTIDTLPSQTSNSGKFLTTNGTSPSWATVDALPSQIGNTGKYLKTDGTSASWDALDISTADITGTLPIANGGTGTTSTTFANLTTNVTGTLPVANGGTGTSTAFTTGSVVFAGASGTYTQDNANFFWDDTNNRLGIGTASPAVKLDVNGNANFGQFINTGTGVSTGGCGIEIGFSRTGDGNSLIDFHSTSGTDNEARILRSSGVNGNFILSNTGTGSFNITNASTGNINLNSIGAGNIVLSTTNTEQMRIDSSGNVGIGTTSPFTKLDVNGTLIAGKNGSSSGYVGLLGSGNTSNTGYVAFYNSSDVRQAYIGYIGPPNNCLNIETDAATNWPIRLATNTTERMRIDASGNVLVNSNTLYQYQPAPTSKSTTATLTGAELMTGILNTTGTSYTVTLPTGTNIDAAVSSSLGVNGCFDWWVINTASGTITIGANSNTTMGGLTIATGTSAQFRFRKTAANTYTVYRLG